MEFIEEIYSRYMLLYVWPLLTLGVHEHMPSEMPLDTAKTSCCRRSRKKVTRFAFIAMEQSRVH